MRFEGGVEQGSEIAVSTTRVAQRVYMPKFYTSKPKAYI
jgi:hypothetical protein